jgi:putative ABC transport system ATP-binding protein
MPSVEAAGAAPSDERGGATAVIRVRGLRKTYTLGTRRVEALRGADLDIVPRAFHAIMGASGSGKSTLLHLLAGLDRPDAGTIEIDGVRLDTMSERDLTEYRRHRVGMVFQQFNLIPTLSALDNVILPAMLDGRSRRTLRPTGERLLTQLGLADRMDHRPDALSGGEQQRVAIARALIFSPRVLLADEPTGNLDSATSRQLWSLLQSLADEHSMTVVMVTHEPAAAVHCRAVFVLRDGRVEGSFDVDGADATDVAARYQRLVGAPG